MHFKMLSVKWTHPYTELFSLHEVCYSLDVQASIHWNVPPVLLPPHHPGCGPRIHWGSVPGTLLQRRRGQRLPPPGMAGATCCKEHMITSWHGNVYHITLRLCRALTISLVIAWQTDEQTFKLPVSQLATSMAHGICRGFSCALFCCGYQLLVV